MISLFFTGTDPDNIISTAKNLLGTLKECNYLNCITVNASKIKAMCFKARNKEVYHTTDKPRGITS